MGFMMRSKGRLLLLVAMAVLLASGASFAYWISAQDGDGAEPQAFDGQRAYEHVLEQDSFGPRTPGSPGHAELVRYITAELEQLGWEVEIQTATMMGHPIQNIVAKRGQGEPWVIFGAHYDTRFFADQDPDPLMHSQPVPGANDGASGVAVLLEMARVLPENLESFSWAGQVWLVFFDAEDQGRIPGWDWILGSQAFVEGLQTHPQAVVIVDMIGDADLNIYREVNSDPGLTDQIWETAAGLGYGTQFINTQKHSILDDHTPFIRRGIPAVDLIDFDYPYWHTVADTPDKVSAQSLQIVGHTLLEWLHLEP